MKERPRWYNWQVLLLRVGECNFSIFFVITTNPQQIYCQSEENVVISNGCEKSPCVEDVRFLPAVEMTKT